MSALCGCPRHRKRTPIEIGPHRYSFQERTEEDQVLGTIRSWRWNCTCSRATGKWQYQSPWSAYHSWLRHVRHAGWRT